MRFAEMKKEINLLKTKSGRLKIIGDIASYKTKTPRKDCYTGTAFREQIFIGNIRLGKPTNRR